MKLLLRRCGICHDWYSPRRAHCGNCGASEVKINPHRTMYVDSTSTYKPFIEIVRPDMNDWAGHALEIARELYERN